ncbi:AAA family ATPase [Actinoallomurus liliacearum]|uniref:AAA family ATPase n=1 Tax=Actinoallomurus liliacearum TaxID=1080073 RepID=A0ABP8TDC9_9ACTN
MSCPACGRHTGESDRFCAGCGAPLAAGTAQQETRKKVSMLFLDIVGSTALAERLDPEPLRQIMDRYFAACGACIAEHGGAVEKFIGDAILAAFGATVAHEDDAVRAARAAAGALAALEDVSAELSAHYQVRLEARAGICTGDVVVITMPGEDFRVIGDSVNTASRLQTAAQPGEILLCADTAAMVRGRVGIDPVAPLRLKGKARPVPAWRVTDAVPREDRPAPATPFIGRDDELDELRHVFRRARQRRQVCLATVLGVPGLGKSRLVQEFLATLADDEVTVLFGRCSAYGRGITYKPLAEMLGSYPGGWPAITRLLDGAADPAARRAHRLAARTLTTVVGEDADPGQDEETDRGGDMARGADDQWAGDDGRDEEVGRGGDTGQVGVEDIAWAVRHLLDVLSRERPVILVWEDLHWAEATLLDLIDEITTWLDDVPVLLLCVARTELLDVRPAWGGGKPSAMTLELGELTYEQSAELVSRLVLQSDVYPQEYQDVYGRVAAQCDGNPLFAELLVDVLAETAPGAQTPPTIQAMLGARLDRLPATERRLLEVAAVIGREFTRDLLQVMADADGIGAAVTDELLARLVRRRVFQRGPAGTFRFAQALLRDTAYDFTPKTRRAHWHDLLAEWLSGRHSQDAMALAYHVEAACRLRRELRPGSPSLPPLAETAANTLIAEGMNALNRKDLPAAVQLLERGRDLLPAGDARHTPLALHICDAGLWLWDEARCLSALAAAEAALPDDRRNSATCAIQRGIVMLRLGRAPAETVTADAALITAALEDDPEDHLSWCRLRQLLSYLDLLTERAASAEASLRLGLTQARAMGDRYEEDRLLCAICELAQWTRTPAVPGLDLCAMLTDRFAANRALLVPVLVTRAHLEALTGDIDGARRTLADALAYSRDLHVDLAAAAVMDAHGFVESLAGAHDAAEARYRQSLSVLRATRNTIDAQTTEVAIARELFHQNQFTAAASALDRVEREGGLTSLRARIGSAALRGRIASAQGRHGEAVTAATAARDLSIDADDLCLAGETLLDLAIVLRAAGRTDQAMIEGTAALRRFETKGATLPADRVRAWLRTGGPGEAS